MKKIILFTTIACAFLLFNGHSANAEGHKIQKSNSVVATPGENLQPSIESRHIRDHWRLFQHYSICSAETLPDIRIRNSAILKPEGFIATTLIANPKAVIYSGRTGETISSGKLNNMTRRFLRGHDPLRG